MKFKLRTPNTIVLLLLLLTLFAALTWIIPGGNYERVVQDDVKSWIQLPLSMGSRIRHR